MRIIDIRNIRQVTKSVPSEAQPPRRGQSHKVTDKRFKCDIKFYIDSLIFGFLVLGLLTGCIQKNELELTRDCVSKSQIYYQHAAERYKKLIAEGNDSDRLHFELGRLYYEHGDFDRALEELKKTDFPAAKKLLAISNYRLGNFTDALEIFNRHKLTDPEYLYYHALTCEKMNLFDRALEIYKGIKDSSFAVKAAGRMEIIEKEAKFTHIRGISPQVDKVLAAAPSAELYPQAGALILYCDEKIEVTRQDTQISYLHYIVKILNERGKDSFSETQIEYDSTYEKVELEYARTIKPNGEVIEVGSRHIRDVSKYLNFPLYSNARVYIISFPGIAEGASIEYKIKIFRNQLINNKDVVLHYTLQTMDPVIAANFTLSVPKEKRLYIKILNEKYNKFGTVLDPDIQEKDGYLVYNWKFKDIPQIIPESNMAPLSQINPTMLISTFASWQDIYNWWWNLAKDKIKADASIKDKVTELTRGRDCEEAKLREIYNFCAQKIRYVAVEYGQAGYEPHYAYDIFRNKYGDCKDQAILLITMLKVAGFNSWPVLIATREYYNLNEDFPAVLFNHCIAAVSLEDKVIFLDPTAQTCSFGDLPVDDQDRKILIFMENGYKIQNTPLYEAGHNLTKQQVKISLDTSEAIVAEREVSTYGVYDQGQRMWLLYTPPELIENALQERIQGLSVGAKLNGFSIKNLESLNEPVVLNYSFQGPEYFIRAGNLRVMPQLAELDASIIAKDRRKYPIDFGFLSSKEAVFDIEIPKNFTIKYIPQGINQDSPWLAFTAEYSLRNNRINFRQKTQLKETVVSEQDYPAFKKFFENLAQQVKQRIILERKE